MLGKCVVLTIFLGFAHSQNDLEVKFIKDFLGNQQEPSVITSFLCWQKNDLVQLQIVFSEANSLALIYNHNYDSFRLSHWDRNLFILDLRCENIETILSKLNSLGLFTINTKYLLFLEDLDLSYLDSTFKTMTNFVSSNVLLVSKTSEQNYNVNHLYKITNDSQLILHPFGAWENGKGFLEYRNRPVTWRRRDLQGTALKASVIYTDKNSLNHMEDYRFGNIDTQMKLNYKLVKYLFEFMNASMDLSFEQAWGEYVGNNTYTGLLGRIHRREIDIAASPLFCIKERMAFYDCVAMTTPAVGFFLFRKPPLSYVANIFTLPFETELWLADIAFLVICSIVLYFAVAWEWKIMEEKDEEPLVDMLTDNVFESIMFTIGTVCQQGYPDEPKSAAGRIIILTLCFTLIFMFTAYSANTVVLFQSSASNIKTLQDLYDSKMSLGVTDMLYYRFWFAKTFEPLRRKIYLERIVPKGKKQRFFPLEEGIQRLRTQYFAFYTDDVSGNQVISDTFEEHEKCGLQKISYLFVQDPWVTAPKNSAFKELFKVGYKIMHERGVLRREIKKHYSQIPECHSQGSNFRSAGILDLYSVYMLYFMGLGTSMGLLLLEIFSKKLIEPRIIKHMMKKMAKKRMLEGNAVGKNDIQRF